MKPIFASVAALSLAVPAAAQDKPMTLEQTMLLRCSAAFAIIANEQERGVATTMRDYPDLRTRGKEYFVRASARLMDELELSREQISAKLRDQVEALQKGSVEAPNPKAYVDGVMQPCLIALDASGL
jgi:hypothetical protein